MEPSLESFHINKQNSC